MRNKINITVILLFMSCSAAADNHYGYYRIHRDSAATARQIDKNLETISANVDTITTNSTELATEISSGFEKNGIRTIKTHQKFYYPLIFFGILYLIWLKTRDQ